MRSSFVVAISGLVALAGVVFGSSGMLYNKLLLCHVLTHVGAVVS